MAKSLGLPEICILNLRYHSFAGFPSIKVTMEPVDSWPWVLEMSYASTRDIFFFVPNIFCNSLVALSFGELSDTKESDNTRPKAHSWVLDFEASSISLLVFSSTDVLLPCNTATSLSRSLLYAFGSGFGPGQRFRWHHEQGLA